MSDLLITVVPLLIWLLVLWVVFRVVSRFVRPLLAGGGRRHQLFDTSQTRGAGHRLPTLSGGGTAADLIPTGSGRALLVLLAVALLGFALSTVAFQFLHPQNLLNMARQVAFVGIIAIGMTAVIKTGGIDLSVGSTVMIAATVTGLVMGAGLPVIIGIPAAIGAALLIGFINGWIIVEWRAPPFLVTLAMLYVSRSVGMILTNGAMIRDFGPDQAILMELGGGSLDVLGLRIPNALFVLVILTLPASWLFRTKWGRRLVEIGADEPAAERTGVPVKAVKISAYMFVAFTAGVCGILYAGLLRSAPAGLGQGMELTAIAAAMIGGASLTGGRGTVLGALAGAALIEVTRNGMIIMRVDTFWQMAVAGLFIVLALALERRRDQGASK